jgi:hypothetical protein
MRVGANGKTMKLEKSPKIKITKNLHGCDEDH